MLAFLCATAVIAQDGFFSFTVPPQFPADSIIHADWIEVPAGKDGPITIKNGHFYTGNKRIKFMGVNLAWEPCFPTKEDANTAAEHLSALGINLVRFHFLDRRSPAGIIARNTPDTHTFDLERLDKLDYFIAQLKKHGIYSDLGLHCTRPFTVTDGAVETDKIPAHSKFVTIFDPVLIQLQKDYARDLLTHKNPYTNLTYAQDPSMAMLEITNENSLFYAWSQGKLDDLSPHYAAILDTGFYDFLKKNGLPSAQRPHFKDSGPNVTVYMKFLIDMESRYFNDIYKYLKNDLGVKAMVTGTMAFGPAGASIQADMDYVDCHAYWEHPAYDAGEWNGSWTIRNSPMVAKPNDSALVRLAAVRVEGKPFTVSEYNHPYPSFYDAEGFPLAAVFAARQDWDALMFFDYTSTRWDRNSIKDFFEIAGHPVKTAELLAASAMFIRSDITPAPAAVCVSVPTAKLPESANKSWWDVGGMFAHMDMALPKVDVRNSIKFNGSTTCQAVAKPDNSYKWTGDGKQGMMIADYPASKAAVGCFNGQPISLGSVKLTIQSSFASITLTSLDNKPIEESSRILLTACGRCQNTGMTWNDAKNSLISWGNPPTLAEGIKGRVELKGNYTVYGLDSSGKQSLQLPTNTLSDCTGFNIGPDSRTLWYLILRKENKQ